VVAAAGCGKTETVARRIERVLVGSADDPFRVLALSYTVRAADEMRDRFQLMLGDHSRRVDTETIHEFAWSLLRQYGTRIGLPVEPEVLTRDEDRVELPIDGSPCRAGRRWRTHERFSRPWTWLEREEPMPPWWKSGDLRSPGQALLTIRRCWIAPSSYLATSG